jgi:hypothetical protein
MVLTSCRRSAELSRRDRGNAVRIEIGIIGIGEGATPACSASVGHPRRFIADAHRVRWGRSTSQICSRSRLTTSGAEHRDEPLRPRSGLPRRCARSSDIFAG